jgi:hypothetical protein
MSTYQTETIFLRHAILYGDGDECLKLEKSLAEVQSDQRCVKRMAWLTAPFLLAGMAGATFAAILQENFPHITAGIAFRLLCGLGLASLICLVGFAVLSIIYRLRLNRLRNECLHLLVKVLESHLGKPRIQTLPGSYPRLSMEQE